MPISALVLALTPAESGQAAALEALAKDERITVGEQQKDILPVVAQTDDVAEGITLVRDELPDIPGVLFVHVVSVDFSDADFSLPENRMKPRTKRTRARGGVS